jgi:hypothetical protein
MSEDYATLIAGARKAIAEASLGDAMEHLDAMIEALETAINHNDYRDGHFARMYLGAREGETLAEACERVTSERDSARAQLAGVRSRTALVERNAQRDANELIEQRAQAAEWHDLYNAAQDIAQEAEREVEALTVEACASRQVGGKTAAEWRERCDSAEAGLAALRDVVLPCSICMGRGVYVRRCSLCDDSTGDHQCDETLRDCPSPACGDLRRALTSTATLAAERDARVRREALLEAADKIDWKAEPGEHRDNVWMEGRVQQAQAIAAHLRALADEDGSGGDKIGLAYWCCACGDEILPGSLHASEMSLDSSGLRCGLCNIGHTLTEQLDAAVTRADTAEAAVVALREAAVSVDRADAGMGSWWIDRAEATTAEQRWMDAIKTLRAALASTVDLAAKVRTRAP